MKSENLKIFLNQIWKLPKSRDNHENLAAPHLPLNFPIFQLPLTFKKHQTHFQKALNHQLKSFGMVQIKVFYLNDLSL